MPNEKTDTPGFNSKDEKVQQENSPKQDTTIGEDIPYASNIPPTLISDDSKNTIAEQDHQGSDNNPDRSRVRNNQ